MTRWYAALHADGSGTLVNADADDGDGGTTTRLLRDGQVVYLIGPHVQHVEGFASQRDATDRLRQWREARASSGLAIHESGGPAPAPRTGGRAGVVPLEGVTLRVRE